MIRNRSETRLQIRMWQQIVAFESLPTYFRAISLLMFSLTVPVKDVGRRTRAYINWQGPLIPAFLNIGCLQVGDAGFFFGLFCRCTIIRPHWFVFSHLSCSYKLQNNIKNQLAVHETPAYFKISVAANILPAFILKDVLLLRCKDQILLRENI